ncbi:hypothetical protein OEZ85_008085 [Tetradesmus obliquus]|uniref:PHD-type domain-containing protein n=1 Tax=Tetradesmus obliquus TaxID=3088 RepID=A0ABY8TMF0_TETOB|nr:hypothetical protein OEZ85_008085 [Tetradesmus obliquus]
MDGDDDNEGACGACKRVGELLCCDGCPAAFHIRCAGYESQSEVPEGEWYCWFCAKERSLPYQHPTNVFKPPRASTQTVMLASDDTAEVFYRCRTVAVSDDYVELQYLDMQRKDEIVHRGSTRLWHGTTDKHAWTLTAKDAYRPNCRLFQVDKQAMAAAVAAARSHKQQQQRLAVAKQLSLRVTSPAAADAAGVQRIPAGEVGAGLPVVVGGASEADFEAALHALWRSLLGPAYPERMPACQLMGGQAVGAWQLWREVWAWGGPDVVSRHKLWATVGFAFNVSVTCTSVSSRIKKSYDSVIEPLDQAIDEGAVTLQRPTPSRQPGDRALQLRNIASSNGGAAAAAPASRPDLQPRRPVGRPRGSKNKRKRAAAGSGSRSGKRRRGAWSSEDDDDPAPDMGSEFDSEEGDDDADDDGDIDGLLGDDGSEDELSEEAGSGEESEGGSPSRKMARTVASMRAARAAAPPAAAAAAAVADGREPPGAMKFAVGKPVLTPAAQQLRVSGWAAAHCENVLAVRQL